MLCLSIGVIVLLNANDEDLSSFCYDVVDDDDNDDDDNECVCVCVFVDDGM
jgi:hypothetical protein